MGKDNLTLSHILDVKEMLASVQVSQARIEERLKPLENGVKKWDEAHAKATRIENWGAALMSIPVIGGVIAFFVKATH